MEYRNFWEAGYSVFGLYGRGPDGKCECGNPNCPDKSLFKHPRVSNWQHTPCWSEEQFETMELMGHFKTGWGLVLGSKNLLGVDVDARNGGLEGYAELVKDHPAIAGAGMIINTGSGSGSKHLLFKVPEGVSLVSKLKKYKGIDFKSGASFIVGAGSMHASGNKYEVALGSVDDIDDCPESLLNELRVPEKHRADVNGVDIDVSHQDLADMLAAVDLYDDYEVWVKIGMAVHHASGGSAFDVWDRWSAQSAKYDAGEMDKKWHSFGRSANPVTLATLVHYAEEGGWVRPVTFTPTIEFEDTPEEGATISDIDTSSIDLLRPPGLVGQMAEWIESRPMRKRERLSVMAAIFALGNICNSRYTDDLTRVNSNLFVFNVAASGTGKDAVQQAVGEIHKVCGMSMATHGSIKSEQEIVRNLVRNQPSFYMIDEIGFFLSKVKNAQEKGGAQYLEGVFGTLMSVYSKANGFYSLSGDMGDEVKSMMRKELMQLEKSLEESGPKPFLERRIQSLTHQLENIDQGIEKPFVSMSGYTTNTNFDKLVTFETATNGFIARAILCTERETAPPSKTNWQYLEMPEKMKNTLQQIAGGGSFDMMDGASSRIEYYGPKIVIPTSSDAKKMLHQVTYIFDMMAEQAKSTTGLEALFMRGAEQVSKVSFILSIPEGLRTEHHVRWAYALVKRDIIDKTRLVVSNDRAKDSPGEALRAKIANLISGEDGETLGVIANKCRPAKKAEVEACLNKMVDAGQATVQESVHYFTKKMIKRYIENSR
jgi:hypothetical protein